VFNFLVLNQGELDGQDLVFDPPIIASAYTKPSLFEHYNNASSAKINQLKEYTCLFATIGETEPTRIGRITHYTTGNSTARFQYKLFDLEPLPIGTLAKLQSKLGLDANELHGRHWSLKEGDLLTILCEAEVALSRPAAAVKAFPTINQGRKIFIGHGRSPVWRELKDFLTGRLDLEHEEFNREPTAGITIIDRLSTMMENCRFAFLVLTAEDEQLDGVLRARQNVVHEAGLFQGKLGFRKAIVLLEEPCEEFSNIFGLGQLRFTKGNITSKFEEVRSTLEREGIIPSNRRS
jgi:predicted nucleotide-binding protein